MYAPYAVMPVICFLPCVEFVDRWRENQLCKLLTTREALRGNRRQVDDALVSVPCKQVTSRSTHGQPAARPQGRPARRRNGNPFSAGDQGRAQGNATRRRQAGRAIRGRGGE